MNQYEIKTIAGNSEVIAAADFDFVSDGTNSFWVFVDDNDNQIYAISTDLTTIIQSIGPVEDDDSISELVEDSDDETDEEDEEDENAE